MSSVALWGWLKGQAAGTGLPIKVLVPVHLAAYAVAIHGFMQAMPGPGGMGQALTTILAVACLILFECVVVLASGYSYSKRGITLQGCLMKGGIVGAVLGLIEGAKGFIYPALASQVPGLLVPPLSPQIIIFLAVRALCFMLAMAAAAAVLAAAGWGIRRAAAALSPKG
jgi:hypothetical protein